MFASYLLHIINMNVIFSIMFDILPYAPLPLAFFFVSSCLLSLFYATLIKKEHQNQFECDMSNFKNRHVIKMRIKSNFLA